MTKGNPKSSAESSEAKFLEEMNRELAGWSDPLVRLRQALARDDLQLYCQPILSLRPAGAILMAEALVRLREEEALLLPPGDFLPVFEHFRMMAELDRWVVRHVVRWLADAPAGALRRFSINVSAQTLEDAAFPAFIADQLRAGRVPPQALAFEMGEGDTLTRLETAARFAHAVRKIGCRVLVDGFGQRSVTFIALKTMHVDFVKVDGSIVRGLLRSAVARHKLQAVVRVGEAIGFEVIAECVEDAAILERLRDMRVGYAQGFGIALPEPIGRAAVLGMP